MRDADKFNFEWAEFERMLWADRVRLNFIGQAELLQLAFD
jgi:hypothetical protein